MKYVILLCVTLFWVPSLALSSSANCEALAAQAAERHGLPKGLLRAIARTESGRAQGKAGAQAWAWTSNVRGKGYYYSGKQEALTHLRQLVARGVRGFDVGCMQLNYRWHGDNFANLDEMIDPARNTEYAARYLSELRAETGSWDAATRYYHSRDPRRGAAYLGRVRQAMARLGPGGTSPEMAQETEVARAASCRAGAARGSALCRIGAACEPGAAGALLGDCGPARGHGTADACTQGPRQDTPLSGCQGPDAYL